MKKRNKVSAEFSMSSLTDIIFLLLIFFMLTSSMIIPNALNLKLPGKSNANPPPSKTTPTIVSIESNGTYRLNGSKASLSDVRKKVRSLKKENKKSFVITPDDKAPNEFVVAVMDLAYTYQMEAIITDPK